MESFLFHWHTVSKSERTDRFDLCEHYQLYQQKINLHQAYVLSSFMRFSCAFRHLKKNVELVVVKGTAHCVQTENPNEFNSQVQRFLLG